MNLKQIVKMFFVTGLILSGIGIFRVTYYQTKAIVAQKMIEHVWEQREISLKSINTDNLKPWPWADTWPILKIEYPNLDNSDKREVNLVLKDISGESLAFGPGLMTENILPGEVGNSFIAAHRDTHFQAIGRLLKNQKIKVTLYSGVTHDFKIDKIKIVDSRNEQAWTNSNDKRITLVTCYPFDGSIANTPFRYLVSGVLTSSQTG